MKETTISVFGQFSLVVTVEDLWIDTISRLLPLYTEHYTSLDIFLGFIQENPNRFTREDSSASDDNGDSQSQSTAFIVGGEYQMPSTTAQFTSTNACAVNTAPISNTNNTVSSLSTSQSLNNTSVTATANNANSYSNLTSAHSASAILMPQSSFERLVACSIHFTPTSLQRSLKHRYWPSSIWGRF